MFSDNLLKQSSRSLSVKHKLFATCSIVFIAQSTNNYIKYFGHSRICGEDLLSSRFSCLPDSLVPSDGKNLAEKSHVFLVVKVLG